MSGKPDIILEPNVPAAFFCRRVSDVKQSKSGLGEEAQLAVCQEYYDRRLKPLGYQFGGDFLDSAVSARKRPFLKRPAVDRMNFALRRGDVVVVSKLDRAFRSMLDFARTMENFRARGIEVAIVNCGIETWDKEKASTNKLLMAILAAVAEWESDMISVRTKEGMAAKVRRGEFVPTRLPPGSKRWGNRIIDDPPEREVCKLIVSLRDKGYTKYQVFCHLRKHGVRKRNGKEWSQRMISTAEQAERKRMLRDEERLRARLALDREIAPVLIPGVNDTAPF